MDKKLLGEINVQINKELFSGYLYLAMAAHFEEVNLPGFAHWMKVQAGEELEHAMKFFEFLNEIGENVVLDAIEKPDAKFGSPLKVAEQVLEHEKFVTSRIHLLYKLAVEANEYPTQIFLQWFVNEQVEEEKNATEIVEQLKLGGESGNSLIMLDRVLAQRKAD
ncbi:MAG: ferritin [Pelolinea sp.]|nr:ferritin [Pelolinea sp.]